MADVIKINRNSGYTTISTHHLWDRALSLKAKGLMSLMLSTPSTWKSSIKGYAQINKDGRDSVNAALQELQKAGYLQITRRHDKRGKFCGYEYTLNELPVIAESETVSGETVSGETVSGETVSGETVSGETVSGKTVSGKTVSGKTVSGKSATSYILNKANNKKANGDGAESDAMFAQFWASYPRKVGKSEARKAWSKLKVTSETFEQIKSGLEAWKLCSQWAKDNGDFIPYPATWLNGHRWEDAPDPKPRPNLGQTPETPTQLPTRRFL